MAAGTAARRDGHAGLVEDGQREIGAEGRCQVQRITKNRGLVHTPGEILDAILEIEELRCLQMNHELHSGGPPMDKLLPYLQRIQEDARTLEKLQETNESLDSLPTLERDDIPPSVFKIDPAADKLAP